LIARRDYGMTMIDTVEEVVRGLEYYAPSLSPSDRWSAINCLVNDALDDKTFAADVLARVYKNIFGIALSGVFEPKRRAL